MSKRILEAVVIAVIIDLCRRALDAWEKDDDDDD